MNENMKNFEKTCRAINVNLLKNSHLITNEELFKFYKLAKEQINIDNTITAQDLFNLLAENNNTTLPEKNNIKKETNSLGIKLKSLKENNRNKQIPNDLNYYQKKIVKKLQSGHVMSNKELAEKINIPIRRVQENTKLLVKQGILDKTIDKKTKSFNFKLK